MNGHVLYEHPPLRMKACRHGTMMYLANDQFIGRSLDLYGEFSEGEIEGFAQILKPGMVAVDVGANIGAHTVYFAAAVGPTGAVIAFEPQRPIFQILCGNLALNGHTHVYAHLAALGRSPGTIKVPPINYNMGANFGGVELGGWTQGDDVPVMTLDSLGLATCHFIKIDVEGMEREVLEGAAGTIARLQPILYVENDRADKSAALIEWLLEQRYRLYWHTPKLFNPDNYFGNSENVFDKVSSGNLLCMPQAYPTVVQGLPEVISPDGQLR